jgi:hypothetical protein
VSPGTVGSSCTESGLRPPIEHAAPPQDEREAASIQQFKECFFIITSKCTSSRQVINWLRNSSCGTLEAAFRTTCHGVGCSSERASGKVLLKTSMWQLQPFLFNPERNQQRTKRPNHPRLNSHITESAENVAQRCYPLSFLGAWDIVYGVYMEPQPVTNVRYKK